MRRPHKIGKNRWRIDYRRTFNGRTIGAREVVRGTRAFAEEVLRNRMYELDRFIKLGEDPDDRMAFTVGQILDDYLKYAKNKGLRSINRIERSIKVLKSGLGSVRADKLTPDMIEEWRKKRYGQREKETPIEACNRKS